MRQTQYTFELHCPRCKKDSVMVLLSADEVDNLKCGDCLMDDVEVVNMIIERVHVENAQ